MHDNNCIAKNVNKGNGERKRFWIRYASHAARRDTLFDLSLNPILNKKPRIKATHLIYNARIKGVSCDFFDFSFIKYIAYISRHLSGHAFRLAHQNYIVHGTGLSPIPKKKQTTYYSSHNFSDIHATHALKTFDHAKIDLAHHFCVD